MTIATMFVATMAWAGVAQAGEPCGAPVETLKSCKVVEEPTCYEVCGPEEMIAACTADGKAACEAKCKHARAIECDAGCATKCEASCSDGAVPEKPKDCTIECGAECTGSCEAACKLSKDGAACMAACNQQCSAYCKKGCDGAGGECQASCEQACGGSCEAEGARDCEIGCLVESTMECKAQMAEVCKEVCEDGAVLVCDEQFVNPTDINACLGALERSGVPLWGPLDKLPGYRGDAGAQVDEVKTAACSVQDQAKLGFAGAFFTFAGFGLISTCLRRRRS